MRTTDRIARACRAASAAAFERQPEPPDNSVSSVLVDVAEMAETTPEREPEWSAALAVLLRELAPEPDGGLAEAEQAVRSWPFAGPSLVRFVEEYDRRGAYLEAAWAASRQIDEWRKAELAELSDLRAIRDRAREMRDDDTRRPGWSMRQANARVILGEPS